MPQDDRPREKLLEKGAFALSNAELIAILLRTGSKNCSALDIARNLVDTKEKLFALRSIKPAVLARQKGIGMAKAVTIVAALELGRRLVAQSAKEKQKINSTGDIVEVLIPYLKHEQQEIFMALFLDVKRQLIGVEKIAQGTLSKVSVTLRDIFSAAILSNAVGIIVAHNHPSGDCKPSEDDKELTNALIKAGKVMDIPLLDHVIIGDGNYYSFLEQDLI